MQGIEQGEHRACRQLADQVDSFTVSVAGKQNGAMKDEWIMRDGPAAETEQRGRSQLDQPSHDKTEQRKQNHHDRLPSASYAASSLATCVARSSTSSALTGSDTFEQHVKAGIGFIINEHAVKHILK